ncbi:hypothetical protein JCM24511_07790 [Saitozyma sp. JCM 24511]|nr:hypothetical protein JCM24511_07790 [Saitozyma sp. JCM 24511]
MSIVELSFALRSMSLSSSAALLSAMSMAFLSSLLEVTASLALSLYSISLQRGDPSCVPSAPVPMTHAPLTGHPKQNKGHPTAQQPSPALQSPCPPAHVPILSHIQQNNRHPRKRTTHAAAKLLLSPISVPSSASKPAVTSFSLHCLFSSFVAFLSAILPSLPTPFGAISSARPYASRAAAFRSALRYSASTSLASWRSEAVGAEGRVLPRERGEGPMGGSGTGPMGSSSDSEPSPAFGRDGKPWVCG